MCLKIEKSTVGKRSKRKYVYKMVLAICTSSSFSNFYSNAKPTKFRIGEKAVSDRESLEVEPVEKFIGEIRKGFHSFLDLRSIRQFLRDEAITSVNVLKCAVDPKDHVTDGNFYSGWGGCYASAVYMSVTPIKAIVVKSAGRN